MLSLGNINNYNVAFQILLCEPWNALDIYTW